jgi:hypothetical protein
MLLIIFVAVGTAQAITGDYFSSFGRIWNNEEAHPGGECVAASFINGAIYLKNQYPAIYGSSKITLGTMSDSAMAMHEFGSWGWTKSGTTYKGYYTRCVDDSNAAVFGDIWKTTVDWMQNSFAPGKTAFSGQIWTARSKEVGQTGSWQYGGNVTECPPTKSFLQDAVNANKFVELSVYTYTLAGDAGTMRQGHALNVLSISGNNITFQDPNNPGTAYTSALTTVNAFGTQALTFKDTCSFGDDPVMILTAIALAPVPEPSTIVMLISVVVGGLIWRRRRA